MDIYLCVTCAGNNWQPNVQPGNVGGGVKNQSNTWQTMKKGKLPITEH